jgi:oxaloacetate decarboxylase gamma subunit
MMGEGFELMVVGMGVVFSFLVLLVVLMRVSGSLLNRLPEPEPAPQRTGGNGNGNGNGQSGQSKEASAKMAVALAAAYRAKRGA